MSPEISNGVQGLWWRDVVSNFQVLPPTKLPKDVEFGIEYTSVCFNPAQYLAFLLNEFTSEGGEVVRATLPEDEGLKTALMEAQKQVGGPVDVFVNATGLRAGKLCQDDKMFPTRGQTILVRGEARRATITIGRKDGGISYGIPRPRTGTTILGGCKEAGSWNENVEPVMTQKILEDAKVLAPELLNDKGNFEIIGEQVGFRPSREGGPRVETEFLDNELVVVHAYGHSGAGYQNSIGSARKVARLVKDIDARA
jgi:glycine/D-amino acid oxidase-like deaminating enzyme